MPTQTKPVLLLFDVYETLLDMEFFEKKVNTLLNSKRGYLYWFEMFMEYCFLSNSLQQYYPFTEIAKATLQMAGRALGETVSDEKAQEAIELFDDLALKEGMTDVFSALYDQGYRIAALTNASAEIIQSRMRSTGLISYFEAVLSAEEVKRYKPAKEVYEWAAKKLELSPSEIMLLSSHSWDIAGAANAGMQTAFLEEPSKLYFPFINEPTYRLRKLEDLVETALFTK